MLAPFRMFPTFRPFGLLLILALPILSAACAGDGRPANGPAGAGAEGAGAEGAGTDETSAGEFAVTLRTWNPQYGEITQTLVNETSAVGAQLMSGAVTSTEVRVLPDGDMETLLDELDDRDFFDHATAGLGLANLPDVPNRRGVVVVEQNGRSRGLFFTTGLGGTPLPRVYTECKKLIFAVHSRAQGFEVRTNVGDPDRVFRVDPIKRPRLRGR